MDSKLSAKELGPALVIGGCGFVGYHLVHNLIQSGCTSIFVISRSPTVNLQKGVTYYAGDITDAVQIQSLIKKIAPKVIFHAASPLSIDVTISASEFTLVNITGTQILLEAAKSTPSVQALVYTSTTSVLKGSVHQNSREDGPLWQPDDKTLPYLKTKAAADILVRAANSPRGTQGLKTCTLRLPMVYGTHDKQTTPAQLGMVVKKQTNVQLGNGKNLIDPLYIGNGAVVHLLAAKALVREHQAGPPDAGMEVGGEAFNITDGAPQPFWDFSRRMWRLAGVDVDSKKVTVVPKWVTLGMASALEWGLWLATLGQKQPPLNLSKLYIGFTVNDSTFDGSKARMRLGYEPVGASGQEDWLREAVAWELENHAERYEGTRMRLLEK